MSKEYVNSICGMCSVRCPIKVEVEDGKARYIEGAKSLKGSLCPRGAAGTALTFDEERPQYPMIRQGERGEGKWKQVSWDEALDYVADKLKAVQKEYGKDAVLFSDRGGPFRDFYRAFLRGIGTANYNNHDSACARNVQNAALSVFGFGRKGVSYDLGNCKHIVLQQRNIMEAINVAECNNALNALDKGAKLTVIDIRANVPATKADNFFMIRPGTDYAFNLAVIHVLINEELYDKKFVADWIDGLDTLKDFVQEYTPEWAERETGVSAEALKAFCRELAEAAPSVIWHPGWMTARYADSFYMTRTIYLINALLGSIGAKGGLPFMGKPGDVGAKGLQSFMNLYPKPEGKRVDGVGWMEGRKHYDAGPGLVNLAYEAIVTGEPYPIKAYIAQRHDPLMAFPDVADVKSLWDNLDLLVAVTFSWSDTAWYADVVLPISPYLERDDTIMTKNGPKPSFVMRKRAMEPIYDTKAIWEIYSGLAKRFGLDDLVYENIEDIWKFQLEGTGYSIEDFAETGSVALASEAVYKPVTDGSFKTPSGKIQVIDEKLEADGLLSLKPYVSPEFPPEDKFRITFGRCALHTQGHTVNNALLFERMPENKLWINTEKAKGLGIETGDRVSVSNNGYSADTTAFVTDFVHPDAVFLVHGFGHTLPCESRAKGHGIADNELMPKGIKKYDKGGGAIAMQEHFVTVAKA
ncbi:molybdopterin-dependent oxidoreductase [Pseudodesulfovibrio cashew]|uniref:Molybdopterin-dependent oxidoreductase n=1 Tax=Pseudodesulfovibrio cashew TaxID=2678688 RepID=A0A6I6JJ53_9BACT|nr:molybdopterin-dependent oxidoreductase [Pseudodesulfovibrio cashew]QGY40342.1 molybdopterin-dependent oxidoreductase [Pseudodesulfovibrio cashew]